ncbi:MAG: sulfatase-like hydrolase/transferase, partial [Desulfobacula sp.]|nr:sulfatase-like hydrolase/transferase [Desulfobacula sp.]
MTLLFTAATHEFFLEYNNTFNIRIFDGLHDDHLAIFKTMMTSYHLIEYIVCILFVAILYAIWGHPFFMKTLQKSMIRKWHPFLNNRLALAIFLLLFTALSFSFAFGPLEADDSNAMRFHSKVLNASVIPGPIALYKATYEYQLKMRSYDKNLYQVSDVVDALTDISGDAKVGELDSHFLKVSSGNYLLPEKPLHIFVLLMERYDSWPLLPKYNSLEVTEGLKAMIEKGMYFKNFLPAGTTTMPAVQTIVLGLPFIGLNAQHFTEKIYPGAIARLMAALGYKTRFFYGGYLNWQNIGLVASSQGFGQVFGAGEKIKKYVQRNEWGIDDVSLFNYISDVVCSDSAPSFNLILTSTNHPPYD